ncbi:MAG: cytochrome c oxidase subunit II [Acidobacteria bacterium]|nr:cytochrome c oxidase subunit II [Acidobacteriota bacterium]
MRDKLKRLKRRAWLLLSLSALCCLFSACSGGGQSPLSPAGSGAEGISRLWWLMFYVCSVVFVLVIAATLLAVFHARRKEERTAAELPATDTPLVKPPEEQERRMRAVVIGSLVLTVAILFVFLIESFLTGRAVTAPLTSEANALTIEVTGHQWWWEVRYVDADASKMFTTANEIHIPVGVPVLVKLKASDVIHSFWVPNLQGKKDLIPGKPAQVWLRADKAGVYRGQCAEFCGMQHTLMAFFVIAEPSEQFYAWRTAQQRTSNAPATATQQRGQQVFLTSPCIMCHTIRGTQAGAAIAPDLTHIASRNTIAAGTLTNRRDELGKWILDSQTVKPGNHMPPNNLSAEDLQALLDYLESLK